MAGERGGMIVRKDPVEEWVVGRGVGWAEGAIIGWVEVVRVRSGYRV